jgi:hypothetical protein
MRRLATLAAIITLVGCSRPTEPTANLSGEYQLASINGRGLPQVTASIPPEVVQVISGRVVLRSDSTFMDETRWQTVVSSPVASITEHVDTLAGTFSMTDSSITMVRQGIRLYTLTRLTDAALARVVPGTSGDLVYRYVKR